MPICPAFMVFYDGPEEEAKTLAAPIFSLGPAMVMGGMTNYTTTTGFPDILKLEGFQRYATSAAQMSYPLDESLMLSTLQLFIEVMQKYGSVLQPSKCFIDLRDYRRMASVPMDATAYANRNNVAIIGVDYQWDDPSLDKEMRAAAVAYSTHVKDLVKERKLKALVHEDGQRDITACYPNFTTGDEKILSVYGENLPRLKELKRKYDPEFMWDKWFPISPE